MAKEIYGYINQEYVNAIGDAHYTFNAVSFSSEDLNRCKKIAHSLYLDSLEAKDVELTGIWSVDILEDEYKNFWLIDMALGYRSAYWNILETRMGRC